MSSLRLQGLIAAFAVLVVLACIMLAQAGPQPSELQKLKLLNGYQRAVLMQNEAMKAQQAFEVSRTDYTKMADEVALEMKLPKGSQFVIDVPGQKVTVQLPQPEKAKPADRRRNEHI